MFIKRVQLEDFKRHKALEVGFSRGINALCGPNGAGKSSVIEAIGLALFNFKPYRSLGELVRKGCKRAAIRVEFEAAADGRLYLAERHLSLSSGNRYILRDATTAAVMAEGTEECQELLCRLMGAEPESRLSDLFKSILGVPQGTLTTAFLLGNNERKTIFGPLLRVEEYERAWAGMRDAFLKPLKEEREVQQRQLHFTRELLATHDETLREFQQCVATIQEHQQQLAALEARKPLLEQELLELRKQQNSLHTLLHHKETLQRQLARSKSHLEAQSQARQEAQRAFEIVQRQEQAFETHQQAKAEVEALRKQHRAFLRESQEFRQLETQLHRLQHQRDQLRSACQKLEAAQREYESLQPALEGERQLEQQLRELQQKLSALPHIQRSLAELKEKIEAQHLEERGLQKELEQLQALLPSIEQLKAVEDEGKILRQQRDQWQRDAQVRQEALELLRQLKEELQKALDDAQEAHRQERNLFESLQPLARRLPEHEKELEGLKRELSRLEAQIEREELFQKDVSGGICPFFSKSCQNVPPGQRLDQFIRGKLQQASDDHRQLYKQVQLKEEQKHASWQAHQKLSTEGQALKLRQELHQREQKRLESQHKHQESQLQRVPDRSRDLAQADERLHGLRHRYKELKPQSEQAQSFYQKQDRLELLQRDLRDKRRYFTENAQARAELEQLQQQLEPLNRELAQLKGPCDKARELSHGLKQYPELKHQLEQLEGQTQELQDRVQVLQQQLSGHTQLDAQLQAKEELMRESEAGYLAYVQNKQHAALLASTQSQLESATQQHEQIAQEFQHTEAEIARLSEGYDEAKLREREAEMSRVLQRAGELKGSLPKDVERRDRLQKQLEKMAERKARLQEEEEESQRTLAVLECSDLLRGIYKDAAPQMTRALIQSISAEADRLFRMLLDQSHLHLRWEESFELVVEEEGNERSFANLSGGEQMAAALAIRLALIKELSSIRVAFFDEPTAHLDSIRRHQLATRLSQIQGFDQLVVISHDDTFETMTDHVIWIRGDQ